MEARSLHCLPVQDDQLVIWITNIFSRYTENNKKDKNYQVIEG